MRTILAHAKRRAEKAGVPFALTVKGLPPVPEVCPVLGIPLFRGGTSTQSASANSPSLDRIIPELGYVPGNVRWISNRANMIKSNATPEELMLVAQDSLRLITA